MMDGAMYCQILGPPSCKALNPKNAQLYKKNEMKIAFWATSRHCFNCLGNPLPCPWWMTGPIAARKSGKVPMSVYSGQVKPVTYRLQLSPSYHISPTFHMTLLKPAHSRHNENPTINELPPPLKSAYRVHVLLNSQGPQELPAVSGGLGGIRPRGTFQTPTTSWTTPWWRSFIGSTPIDQLHAPGATLAVEHLEVTLPHFRRRRMDPIRPSLSSSSPGLAPPHSSSAEEIVGHTSLPPSLWGSSAQPG
ncbi:hypothetical protein QTP86_000954 [Hemibagrus guttatus]|nr:hypothetical protein QTP86_000954 [Hemibagrus guttatus]